MKHHHHNRARVRRHFLRPPARDVTVLLPRFPPPLALLSFPSFHRNATRSNTDTSTAPANGEISSARAAPAHANCHAAIDAPSAPPPGRRSSPPTRARARTRRRAEDAARDVRRAVARAITPHDATGTPRDAIGRARPRRTIARADARTRETGARTARVRDARADARAA